MNTLNEPISKILYHVFHVISYLIYISKLNVSGTKQAMEVRSTAFSIILRTCSTKINLIFISYTLSHDIELVILQLIVKYPVDQVNIIALIAKKNIRRTKPAANF